MTEIVNLRQARKRKVRAEQETHAEQNRAAHGLSKAQKRKARDESAKAERRLDGKRLDPEP